MGTGRKKPRLRLKDSYKLCWDNESSPTRRKHVCSLSLFLELDVFVNYFDTEQYFLCRIIIIIGTESNHLMIQKVNILKHLLLGILCNNITSRSL